MITKEIERVGIPAVQICTIIPIAETVGANRIQKAVAIPYPVGNPNLKPEEEYTLRRSIVEHAIQLLCRKVSKNEEGQHE